MKTADLAHKLLPTTNCPMDEKWKAAWALLDELPDVPIEHRCHARCWLTYRAIDGHIKQGEYELRVWKACEIPAAHPDAPRWITSQAAAEFYLWTLWGDEARSFQANNELYNSYKSYPPAILSMLRVHAVDAYRSYLNGDPDLAKHQIVKSVSMWREVMASFDWQKYPLRFMDGKGDMLALHALVCIAARLGIGQEWMKCHENAVQTCNEPWVRCIKHLSAKPGAIWK